MISREERQRAARIHYSFLPEEFRDGHMHIAVNCVPWSDIGGDYCSILPLNDGRVVVCLCDAVGHDVGSALYAARINTFVIAHAPRVSHPCELLDELNAFLREAALRSPLAEQIDYTASTEIVSTDLVGSRHAGVVDSASIIVNNDSCVLYVWYDNEMGYSTQCIRILQAMAGLRLPVLPEMA